MSTERLQKHTDSNHKLTQRVTILKIHNVYMQKATVPGGTHKHISRVRAACTLHRAPTNATLAHCFRMVLLLSKIIAVIRSSHKGRVTDGDKLAGKKTAMHRYLKKRHANTSNSGKRFYLGGLQEKKITPSNI